MTGKDWKYYLRKLREQIDAVFSLAERFLKDVAEDRSKWLSTAVKVFTFLVVIFLFVHEELAIFISTLLGGGLLIWQIYAYHKRASASEKTAEAMQRTAEATEKGNVAERFKNAIEHLGNADASVRLGGIYALHSIAQEVEEYKVRVFEILCAHIRERTNSDNYEKEQVKGIGENKLPSNEIQSILDLFFNRDEGRETYDGLEANLQGAKLNGAKLVKSKLEKAILGGANLQEAILSGANLQGAVLYGANLQKAFLDRANLQEAKLFGANFQGARLFGANLQGADLRVAKLEACQLLKVKTLYEAKLDTEIENEIKEQKRELFSKV